MPSILLRTVLIYAILTCVMRFMGKRQIGEMQLSELIIALLLSEIATSPVTDPDMPLSFALISVGILISLEIILSFLAMKSPFCKKLFDGKPAYLIFRGHLLQDELSKTRMSMEELLGELRRQGYSDIRDVYYALIEQNGKISFFPRAQVQTVRACDLSLNPQETGILHPLITDGHISQYNLELTGHDTAWLSSRLREYGIRQKQVFLFAIDDAGGETMIRKE